MRGGSLGVQMRGWGVSRCTDERGGVSRCTDEGMGRQVTELICVGRVIFIFKM